MYTVVIPTRPAEPFIGASLDSIAEQSVAPARVIVVVNGADAVGSALGSRARRHPLRPEVIETPRAGTSNALATAIELVESPHVAVLDADDLWMPSKQADQMALLEEQPHAHAVCGGVANFRELADGSRRIDPPRSGRLFGATTFRRSAFTEFGLPDRSAAHFTWLYRWWSTAQAAGIVTVTQERLVLLRRVHAANGWVSEKDAGRQQLLGELRRLTRLRGMDS